MTKKFSRMISCLLCLILILCLGIIPSRTVHAVESGEFTVLGTMDACYADEDLKSYLMENGVNVQPGDEISLIQNRSRNRAIPFYTELQVVQYDDVLNEYCVSTVLAYTENSEGILPTDVSAIVNKTRGSHSISYDYKNNTITLTIIANYDKTTPVIDNQVRTAYNPKSIGFKYTKTSSATVSVNSVDVTLTTSGDLYSFNLGQTTNYDYTYNIRKNQSNPTAGTTYSQSGGLASGLSILNTGGNQSGVYYTYTIKFSDGTLDAKDRPLEP